MAHYSGTASTLSDLRTALLTHAQTDGWVLTGDVLSKAGVYFKIQVNADNITCLGCESNAAANPAPGVVMIGTVYKFTGQPTRQISFPCTYEVFGFAQELYLVVNYDVDTYQWMAIGKTTVPGVPGQGGWCAASIGSAWASVSPILYGGTMVVMGPAYFSLTTSAFTGGDIYLGFPGLGGIGPTSGAANAAIKNVWVNSNLDAHGWMFGDTSGVGAKILNYTSQLLAIQPSAWNSEATLLPLRCYKERPSFKSSLILDCENARHIRVDNFTPGDILTLGVDKWKVFPWYRKNIASRSSNNSSPYDFNHTGTLGWAIRYEGP